MLQRTRTGLVAVAVGLALLMPFVLAAPPVAAGPSRPVQIDPSLLQPGNDAAGGRAGLPGAGTDRVSLILRLQGPTLWQIYQADQQAAAVRGTRPMTTATLQGLHDAMMRRQQPTIRAVEALGADVVDGYQAVLNGLLVHATRSQVPALAQLRGVTAIARAPILETDLSKVIPTIQADKVYQELGFYGSGAVVAVIDTGIDYNHQAFGGEGADAYQNNDEEVVEPGSFPTEKVIGGYDLAGTRYSAACPDQPPAQLDCTKEPMPDDDPLDPPGQGHGSHVSGIVASMGVSSTVSIGVAPGASLVALKVFGDPIGIGASTDLAASAMEWVTKHNMGMSVPGEAPDGKINVINMSLGASWGGETELDNDVIDAVVATGVTVVASAGNSGPYVYITGNPSGAVMALSVASSWPGDQGTLQAKAEWTENGAAKVENEDALQAAAWVPQLEEIGAVRAQLAWYGQACNDASGDPSPPAQDVREKIALIERGTCPFYDKLWNAQKQGAVAALVYTDAARPPVNMGCGAPSDCLVGPDIPGVMVANDVGLRWRGLVEGGVVVTSTLDPNNLRPQPELTDVISDFSSRGPSRFAAGIKPQITAPGSNISSVAAGTGDRSVALSGTSMSSPAVAGVAALLWERNTTEQLGLSGADIAALAMNYAQAVSHVNNNQTGPLAAVARQGSGRVNAYLSAVGETLVRSDPGIAELNFGNVHVTDDTAEKTLPLIVENMSTSAKSYATGTRLAFPESDANKGVEVLVQPQRLTVAAGMTATIEVTLAVNPNRLRTWQLSGYDAVSPGAEPAVEELEIDGYVSLTEVDQAGQPVTDGDVVGVPFYTLPRRHACVGREPAGGFVLPQQGASVELPLRNRCQSSGTLQVMRLAGEDKAESATNSSFPEKLDMTAVGLHYGMVDTGQGEELLMEVVPRTVGSRRIPIDAQVRIYFDFDNDGRFDRMLFNVYGPAVAATAPPGQWLVISAPLAPGTLDPDLANAAQNAFFQVYDIDETTTGLLASIADMDPDGSFDLVENVLNGRATFGVAARVIDDPEDFLVTDGFPGFDDAPDGLKPANSPAYTYSQALNECVQVETMAGDDLGVLGAALIIAGNRTATIKVTAGCAPPAGPGQPVGLLLGYEVATQLADGTPAFERTNLPGAPAAEVQTGLLGKPTIFLPLALQNEDWDAEAQPTPTTGTP